MCREGYYFKPDLGCFECGEGLVCPQGNSPPTQLAGYRAVVQDWEARTYSMWRCDQPLRCPQGALDVPCVGNSYGVMCAYCPLEPRRTRWDDSLRRCVDCSDKGYHNFVAPMGVLTLVTAAVLCYRFALPRDGVERLSSAMEVTVTLGLLLVLCQTAAIFGRLQIPWPSPLRELLEFAQVLALNFDFLEMGCL